MSGSIEWSSFVGVFAAALIAAVVLVLFYSLGLRLLVRAGRSPVVGPAEFTDAIAVITPAQARRAEKAAHKAARRSPLTPGQRRLALVMANACFAVCGAAVLAGIAVVVARSWS